MTPFAKSGYFDIDAFFSALDAVRQSRKLTWKGVATRSGVSASTLTRVAQGRRLDLDGLAALATWSGLSIDTFVRKEEGSPSKAEPLAQVVTYLRADPHLSTEGAKALEEVIKATYSRLRKD